MATSVPKSYQALNGKMAHLGRHAIVIGASMGGLLAGRADYYDEVTLVDRDALPLAHEPRKGVPQGRHTHGLLARGREVLDELFPGFTAEMVAEGAVSSDVADDVLWFNHGFYLRNVHSDLSGLAISRPMLECGVRRRLLQLPNVRIRQYCNVLGPICDCDRNRVTGVQVTARNGSDEVETISSDLVVDASGRGSRSPSWLDALGYARPREEQIKVNIGYKTRLYRRRPEDLHGKHGAIGLIGVLAPFWCKRVNGGPSALQATSTMKFQQMKSGLLNSREVCLSRRYSTSSNMQNHWVQS